MTLTVIWLLPLVASVLIAFMPSRLAKSMAVLVSLATFGNASSCAKLRTISASCC